MDIQETIGEGKLSDSELLNHLLSISNHMASIRALQPLLLFVVDEMIKLTGAEQGYIVLLQSDDQLMFPVRRRADGTDVELAVDSISRSILDEVVQTQQPLIVRNALMNPNFNQALSVVALQLRSIMCAPLITQNRLLGAIYVENRSKSGRFSQNDLTPLAFFSNQAAVAIENAYLNENLEGRVIQRTEELALAKEQAEKANLAKSRFLSSITHELRTPMNGVLGMTSLLLDTRLDEEQRDIVKTIRTSGNTLLTLISDILDFSKIEANKLDLEARQFELSRCIEEAIDLVTPQAAEKGLNLAFLLDEDVPADIVQDVTRVRQILANLLSNGVKFTESGEVLVKVRSEAQANDKLLVTFVVQDTGIGIPADRLDRLFKSFSQVDSSTTRKYGGTGLGLVISKHLSEMMGGKMWVESEEGIGSTFSFSILADSVAEKTAVSPQTECTILVASQNTTNRQVLQNMLSRRALSSQHVTLTHEPIDALAEAQLQKADLLIIDLFDSISLGKQMLPQLRQTVPQLPILAVLPWGERLEPAEKITAVSFPIKASQLYNAISSYLFVEQLEQDRKQPTTEFDSEMGKRQPLRVLLAEDNLINQKVAVGMLMRLGYQADVVSNGLEAVTAVREHAYDVVFMDVQMPKLDGVGATHRIRKLVSDAIQPSIIAMTANAMEGDREKYLKEGMDDYVSKPVRLSALKEVLQSSWEQRALN